MQDTRLIQQCNTAMLINSKLLSLAYHRSYYPFQFSPCIIQSLNFRPFETLALADDSKEFARCIRFLPDSTRFSSV